MAFDLLRIHLFQLRTGEKPEKRTDISDVVHMPFEIDIDGTDFILCKRFAGKVTGKSVEILRKDLFPAEFEIGIVKFVDDKKPVRIPVQDRPFRCPFDEQFIAIFDRIIPAAADAVRFFRPGAEIDGFADGRTARYADPVPGGHPEQALRCQDALIVFEGFRMRDRDVLKQCKNVRIAQQFSVIGVAGLDFDLYREFIVHKMINDPLQIIPY